MDCSPTQAPLSKGFSRQEYWSGLPFPPPGDLPNPGISCVSCISCIGRQILYHCTTWEAWRVPFSLPNWMHSDWSPSLPIPRYSPFFPDPQTSRGAGLASFFFCLSLHPSRTGVLALPLTSCGDQPGRCHPVILPPRSYLLHPPAVPLTWYQEVPCDLQTVRSDVVLLRTLGYKSHYSFHLWCSLGNHSLWGKPAATTRRQTALRRDPMMRRLPAAAG